MSNENRVLWAQILGLIAIVAARFGIDISADVQADILAGLSAFGLVLTAVLAKVKPSAATPGHKQTGRALPALLLVTGMGFGGAIFLQGCSGTHVSTNHTIKGASLVAEQLVEQISLAQKTGQISVERENVLLDRIAHINQQLRVAVTMAGAEQLDLEAINRRLTEIRLELAREPMP